jgi:hypothetical protein
MLNGRFHEQGVASGAVAGLNVKKLANEGRAG